MAGALSELTTDGIVSSTHADGRMRKLIGLILGPLLLCLLLFIGAPEGLIEATRDPLQAKKAWTVLCVLILMAVWWVTEAIPLPVTALLPIVLLPLMGVQSLKVTSAEYMHPIIVLLMGGFIIAKAIERWDLHKRIALNVVNSVGFKPAMLVGGFMLAGAILSMWISNSATCIMLTPIALSVAHAVLGENKFNSPFTYSLLLGIAYACSVGGLGTPVGTPTNLIVIGYLNDAVGMDISFGQWVAIGFPTVFIIVPVIWFILTKIVFKTPDTDLNSENGRKLVRLELETLGKISIPEKRTLYVFAAVAFLWCFRGGLKDVSFLGVTPFSGLTDAITAIIGVLLCFLIPSGSKTEKGSAILDWKTAEGIPWGPLLLFGGGMSIAYAIRTSGLGDWVGTELGVLATMPLILLVFLLTALVIFITEVLSNVATASTLMPILGAAALSSGLPVELIALPIAMAASCAFMLPTATGPNAVVFASGEVSLPTMVKAGFIANLVAIPVITVLSLVLAPVIFG